MVSQHIINIVLKAEDQVSQVTQKVENTFNKLGGTAKTGMDQASKASEQFSQKVKNTAPNVDNVSNKIKTMGTTGSSSFNQLATAEGNLAQKMNTVTPAIQSAQSSITQFGSSGMQAFQSMSSAEQQAAIQLSSLGTTASTVTSSISSNIRTKISTAWDGVKTKASTVADSIKSKFSSALSSVKSKVSSIGSSFSGLGGVISSALGTIGMTGVSQLTVGLAMTREQMTSLTQATMGSKSAADDFVNTMDQMTNNSLVSLNDLGKAMNTIKMSTGMSNSEMKSFATTVNDVGQRAILMGYSGDEAMTIMQAAGRGLNGEFDILKSNFGITKETLTNLGWSGAADDVAGYQAALDKALAAGGSMDEMMNTTTGLIKQVEKGFTSAGRQIGEMFIPYIRMALQWMVNMKGQCPQLYSVLIGIAGAISLFATIAPSLSPILTAFSSISSAGRKLLTFFGVLKAKEDAVTLSTIKNTLATKLNAVQKGLSTTANSLYGASLSGLSMKQKLVTAATWLWNAALSANPILIVVLAIAALVVAIYEVGKAFGWWSNVSEMLQSIWSGIQRVWNAFINHPDVQATIQVLTDVWNGFVSVLGQVWNAIVQLWPELGNTGQVDAVSVVIQVLGTLFSGLLLPIKALVTGCQSLYTILMTVGTFIQGVFAPAWQLISAVLQFIGGYVLQIISVFQQFLSGQITLPQMLTQIWTIIQQMFTTILTLIISRVVSWASQLYSNAVSAGSRFLQGVITYIRQLPGRVYSYLSSVVSRIVSAGARWVSSARSKASAMVSGVVNWVKQLPGKVYTEFMNIGSRILSAGSDLVNKAKQIGKNIVNGLLNAMGIHSPGIIQESVVTEFENMVVRVKNQADDASVAADKIGSEMVSSFKNVELENALDFNLLNPIDEYSQEQQMQTALDFEITKPVMESPEPVVGDVSADSTGYQEGMVSAEESTLENNQMITDSYGLLSQNMQLSLANMLLSNQTTYGQMQLNEQTSMNQMSAHVLSSMNSILASTKTGLGQTTNTTKSNLLNMQNSTTQTTQKMVSAWNTMKTSIVNAANKIKTQSTNHFNKLSSTIGSFYRKLRNPSGWGAGPVSGGRRGHASPKNRMSRISSSIARTVNAPSTVSVSQVKANPCFNEACIEYLKPQGANVSMEDLIRGGCINCVTGVDFIDTNKGAGGWDVSPQNNAYIKKISREWDMKGPIVAGKYQTGISFKVKEFENGEPTIDFASFKSMAEDVFSQCHYEFYYDSEKYGNWVNAFYNGGMNCSDSSDALIWMANACGFSAYKQHGHWGSVGHYWAVVNGQKMDTTGWMNQRTWTPSQSHAGPARRKLSETPSKLFENIERSISNNNSNDEESFEYSTDNILIDGELTVKHEFLNLPDGIDEKEIANMIQDTTNDATWIKKLVNNTIFQKADSKAKLKLERSNSRAIGV